METGELSIGIYTGGREMRQEAKYCAGSDAKLQGASYEPSQSLHWRMGWLETWPEQNIRHTNLLMIGYCRAKPTVALFCLPNTKRCYAIHRKLERDGRLPKRVKAARRLALESWNARPVSSTSARSFRRAPRMALSKRITEYPFINSMEP